MPWCEKQAINQLQGQADVTMSSQDFDILKIGKQIPIARGAIYVELATEKFNYRFTLQSTI